MQKQKGKKKTNWWEPTVIQTILKARKHQPDHLRGAIRVLQQRHPDPAVYQRLDESTVRAWFQLRESKHSP